jgi:hypothetical protein
MAWLNGWRRLWIVWVVLSLPIAFVGVARSVQFDQEWNYWYGEKTRASNAAWERARQRISARLWPTIDPATGERDNARHETLVLGELSNGGDDELRSELKKINDEYDPKLENAHRDRRNSFLTVVVVVWLLLVVGMYGAGATASWVRRGFKA